jgi:hypothetical protein
MNCYKSPDADFIDSLAPGAFNYNLSMLMKRILPMGEFKFKDTQKVLYYTQFFWQCKITRLNHFFKIMKESFACETTTDLKKLRSKFYNHRFYMLTTHKLDSMMLFPSIKSFSQQLSVQNKPSSMSMRRVTTTNRLDVNQRSLGLLLKEFNTKVPSWLMQAQKPEIRDRIQSCMGEISSIQEELLIATPAPMIQQLSSSPMRKKLTKSINQSEESCSFGTDSDFDSVEDEDTKQMLMNQKNSSMHLEFMF